MPYVRYPILSREATINASGSLPTTTCHAHQHNVTIEPSAEVPGRGEGKA